LSDFTHICAFALELARIVGGEYDSFVTKPDLSNIFVADWRQNLFLIILMLVFWIYQPVGRFREIEPPRL
jgi:hypothetical protein